MSEKLAGAMKRLTPPARVRRLCGPRLKEFVLDEERGAVCLEEEVERMRESGMAADEIADRMGVDAGWVESLIVMWEGGEKKGG